MLLTFRVTQCEVWGWITQLDHTLKDEGRPRMLCCFSMLFLTIAYMVTKAYFPHFPLSSQELSLCHCETIQTGNYQ